jgi:hypothetical protein
MTIAGTLNHRLVFNCYTAWKTASLVAPVFFWTRLEPPRFCVKNRRRILKFLQRRVIICTLVAPLIVKAPVTFHYQNAGHSMRYRRPTITVDDSEQPMQIFYAPPFQGPLECEPELVPGFYRAMSRFDSIIVRPDLRFSIRLQPGDCAIFANRRVLHGRAAFDAISGQRHLKGAYIDWDVFADRYRVLRQKFAHIV